jgi:CRISPR-associated RAMP protein (TIGR02581 family)
MMFDVFHNRVTFSGWLTAETALRIGAGRATDVVGTDLPVVRDALGRPYIPGSSFKGALRAYTESLVRAVNPSRQGACNPVGKEEEWCLKNTKRVKDGKEEEMEDAEIDQQSCLVCQVYGSHWMAARVSIRDLLVDDSLWYGQFEVRNGVGLDRDTETVVNSLLYDFEVVPVGTRFRCEIVAENMEDWQLGLLLAGLRPFEAGQAALGGARSRGLGVVRIEWEARTRVDRDGLLDWITGESEPLAVGTDETRAWLSAFKKHLLDFREAAHA